MKGDAGIVNTLTEKITKAKEEAVQTAEEDATKKANDAKAEATQYTNSKLADYYTKAEVDESQQKQDARIKKLEDARPTGGAGTLYDFSKADAVKTGETIKLSDGTVKDIYRLCVERENVQDFFNIPKADPMNITRIVKISGTATRNNDTTEDVSHLVQAMINNVDGSIDVTSLKKIQFLIF